MTFGHATHGARARTTDPTTSHAAAASVQGLPAAQAHILALYQHQGAMTDGDLINLYDQMVDAGDYPPLSDSGIRTRRNELWRRGRLVDTGRKGRTAAGRRTILWAAA